MYENTKVHIIKDYNLLERFFNYCEKTKSNFMSFDVETDSPIPRKADLYGIGICFNTQHAFYIPWRKKPKPGEKGEFWWDKNDREAIVKFLDGLVDEKNLIAHNGVFDVLVMKYNCGVDWTHKIYSDTILMKHTVDEEKPHGLKPTSIKYLGPEADTAQEDLKRSVLDNGGRWTKDEKDMYLGDTDILGKYCCWDTLLTYDLFVLFSKMLKEQDLEQLFYVEEIMPLYRWCTIPMKDKGFPVDVPYYKELEKELRLLLNKLEKEVVEELTPYAKECFQELMDQTVGVKSSGSFVKTYAEQNDIPIPITKDGKVTLAAPALKKQKENSPDYNDFYDYVLSSQNDIYEVKEYKEFKKQVDTAKSEKKAQGIDTRTDEDIKELNKQLKELELQQNVRLREISYEFLDCDQVKLTQEELFKEKKKQKYLINIKSGDQLGLLFFKGLEFEPKKISEKTGKPSVNSELLDELLEEKIDKHPFLRSLYDYRKLDKLYSTYVIGILERQIDGIIYTDMLQFGTTSGRYSSQNPNLQNQPRIKDDEAGLSPLVLKYVNAIRAGFKAPEGYKIVNADYSQLEPCCFAHMSGDEKLRNVFRKGEDLYARVSIDVFGLHQYSANKKDDNYLKKKSPEQRAQSKVFTLAVPYGAEAGRISEAMGKTWEEAKQIIDKYLNAYPDLKKFMKDSHRMALSKGYVRTDYGRIRHLPEAKALYEKHGKRLLNRKWAKEKGLGLERYKLKSFLNNSTNVRIQGIAAHIVNRAMIAMAIEIHNNNWDAWIGLQVHDEITIIARKDIAEKVAERLKYHMENTTTISVPLVAEPLIADRWSEAK